MDLASDPDLRRSKGRALGVAGPNYAISTPVFLPVALQELFLIHTSIRGKLDPLGVGFFVCFEEGETDISVL